MKKNPQMYKDCLDLAATLFLQSELNKNYHPSDSIATIVTQIADVLYEAYDKKD
jgi:hypothetical protein